MTIDKFKLTPGGKSMYPHPTDEDIERIDHVMYSVGGLNEAASWAAIKYALQSKRIIVNAKEKEYLVIIDGNERSFPTVRYRGTLKDIAEEMKEDGTKFWVTMGTNDTYCAEVIDRDKFKKMIEDESCS